MSRQLPEGWGIVHPDDEEDTPPESGSEKPPYKKGDRVSWSVFPDAEFEIIMCWSEVKERKRGPDKITWWVTIKSVNADELESDFKVRTKVNADEVKPILKKA